MSTNDTLFKIVLKNDNIFKEEFGQDEADGLIIRCIERDFIQPKLREKSVQDWDSLQIAMKEKFNRYGEEAVLQARVFYDINNKHFDDLSNIVSQWYSLYGDKRGWINDEILNNIAWAVFDNLSDVKALDVALAMSKKAIANDNQAHKIDTYANLLYKCGKRSEAIQWEQKAVNISGGEDIFVQTLDKMKKGKRTWN